jgi:hypothetical protein
MKTHTTAIGTSLLLSLTAPVPASPGQQAQETNRERIGIYDSRSIAVAYVGSIFQEEKMQDLTNRFRKAKEAGDTKEVSRLKAEGRAWQAQLHRQGFGTAPVDDLLAHIAGDLPKIQQAAGVTSLVSKWDQSGLARHPKADRIDVTMQLVDAFRPNEKQRQAAVEIQAKRPVKVKD